MVIGYSKTLIGLDTILANKSLYTEYTNCRVNKETK